MNMQYVIIGNSTAAVAAAEQIRRNDGKGKITMISDEPYHTYGRPLISYYLLGKTDAERMKYRPSDFYERNRIDTIFPNVLKKSMRKRKKFSFRTGKKSVTISCS